MEGYVATLTYFFAVGTVLLLLVLFVSGITRVVTGQWFPRSVDMFLRRHLQLGLMVLPVASVVLSLWYSEVVGFAPCPLCWFARTMMFPLAVVGVVAFVRKDTRAWPYAFALALVGMLITGYHHLLQIGFVQGDFCSGLAGGGDCAKRYVFEFDFVTLPLMGFAMFSVIALTAWLLRTQD